MFSEFSTNLSHQQTSFVLRLISLWHETEHSVCIFTRSFVIEISVLTTKMLHKKNYQLNTDSKYFSLHILFFDFVLYLFVEVLLQFLFHLYIKTITKRFKKSSMSVQCNSWFKCNARA